MRWLVMLLAVSSVAGAQVPTAAAPAKAAKTSPWFRAQTMDFAAITPPPPAAGSEADKADMKAVLDAQRTRTAAEVKQAQADDKEEDMFVFATVLGPKFSAEALPRTAAFSLHLRQASAVINNPLKETFGRPRPFVASAQVQPVCEKTASKSYPSGHSMVGTLEGLALVEIVPERSAEIQRRLEQYLHDRVVCGVHYPSDVAASRITATALFGLISASPEFQQEMAAAKAEVREHLGLGPAASPR